MHDKKHVLEIAMLQEIITGTILYWSTAMDLILISVVMIASHPIAGKNNKSF